MSVDAQEIVSLTQEMLNSVGCGDINSLYKFINSVVKPVIHISKDGADTLIPFLACILSQTNISENDLTNLNLINEFLHISPVYSGNELEWICQNILSTGLFAVYDIDKTLHNACKNKNVDEILSEIKDKESSINTTLDSIAKNSEKHEDRIIKRMELKEIFEHAKNNDFIKKIICNYAPNEYLKYLIAAHENSSVKAQASKVYNEIQRLEHQIGNKYSQLRSNLHNVKIKTIDLLRSDKPTEQEILNYQVLSKSVVKPYSKSRIAVGVLGAAMMALGSLIAVVAGLSMIPAIPVAPVGIAASSSIAAMGMGCFGIGNSLFFGAGKDKQCANAVEGLSQALTTSIIKKN